MQRGSYVALGTGRGKILLFGEHAAVYGYPALGATISLETRVEYTPGSQGIFLLDAPDKHHQRLEELIRVIARELTGNDTDGDGTYRLSSTIPPGSGMGSSAAVSAALTRAIAEEHAPGQPLATTWAVANAGEKIFHGTPSGIDTGLALRSGIVAFRKSTPEALPDAEPIPGIDAYILVATVPRHESTGAIIASLKERIARDKEEAGRALGALGGFTESAVDVLKLGNETAAASLGKLADQAHFILDSLELSTPEINTFLEEGKAAGALGGKISGAGGGGACFLVFPSRSSAKDTELYLKDYIHSTEKNLTIHGVFSLL